ncbi:lytic transglycosylase domain-containing protein [Cryptosporangium arvum]|uniref:lytic transglycosylase domain-containing protein n=1 Tax=Cryptosporangium arvum TaxID=80871 RepID=UPI0004BBFEC2|nr:lytic transglycosylase domain-containing protein [Cryptosporangium arvum]
MGNDDEDGLNQTPGSDPDGAPSDEPPSLSAEPWRQAAVAWTQHAEAWAAQTEAAQTEAARSEAARSEAADFAARSEAARSEAVRSEAAEFEARSEAARIDAAPDRPAHHDTLPVPAEPHHWVSPAGDPARTQPTSTAPTHQAEPTPAHPVPVHPLPINPAPAEVDDLGEMPEEPPVSPWPDLAPDERSAHAHVWPPSRSRRSLAPLAGAAAFVLCLATASVAVWSWTRPEPQQLSAPPPPLASAPAAPSAEAPALAPSTLPEAGAASAPVNPAPTGGRPEQDGARPADALAHWADALRQLDIPPTALQAYGYAEAVIARAKPRCRLSWTLLAAIGAVESNHGRYGGAALQPDGTSSRPIIGVPLAGIGVERVTDTDQGLLDGDVTFDRAIGPMQFLPATWKAWAVDADDNGRADPYDIDDASLAAGYYLCAGGQNLASGSGWSSAVFSYNRVPAYVERVYEFADAYGRAS